MDIDNRGQVNKNPNGYKYMLRLSDNQWYAYDYRYENDSNFKMYVEKEEAIKVTDLVSMSNKDLKAYLFKEFGIDVGYKQLNKEMLIEMIEKAAEDKGKIVEAVDGKNTIDNKTTVDNKDSKNNDTDNDYSFTK